MYWRTINVAQTSGQITFLIWDNLLSKCFHKELEDLVKVGGAGISLILSSSLLIEIIDISSSITHFCVFSALSANPNAIFF